MNAIIITFRRFAKASMNFSILLGKFLVSLVDRTRHAFLRSAHVAQIRAANSFNYNYKVRIELNSGETRMSPVTIPALQNTLTPCF